MTVTLWQDEPHRVARWQFSVAPVETPEVDVYGEWYPLSMTGVVGELLLCGDAVSPVPPGHVVIDRDWLPRVRADGEIHTGDWIRYRQVPA